MTVLEGFGLIMCMALGGAAGYGAGATIKSLWEDSDPTLTPWWVTPLGIVLATVGLLAGTAAGVYFAYTT
jgi:hypothetical protein